MGRKSKRKNFRTETRVELTQAEVHDFLRTVHDDLALLRRIDFAKPLRSEVRVASAILRRLLYEQMLLNAWKLAGLQEEPHFNAVDLDSMLQSVDRKYISYAYAGGATTEGAQYIGYILLVVPKAELELEGEDAVLKRVSTSMSPAVRRDFSLSEFYASTCVASGHAGVSRIEMIRYVANKLGGVHWDNQRGAWTDPIDSRHRLLDEEHLIVGRLPAPLYETLSIAQAVAESADTLRLMQTIDVVAPEEEGAIDILRFREGRAGKYADMTFNVSGTPPDGAQPYGAGGAAQRP